MNSQNSHLILIQLYILQKTQINRILATRKLVLTPNIGPTFRVKVFPINFCEITFLLTSVALSRMSKILQPLHRGLALMGISEILSKYKANAFELEQISLTSFERALN